MECSSMDKLIATEVQANLVDYQAVKNFDWSTVEQEFSWFETGKLNIAYEAIDKHANSARANKIALYYSDTTRNESYTFLDLMIQSNKAANVLKEYGNVVKGDRVFIFMPRSPELYFALLGALKTGAIVGPLFEAFMEGAVFDRLYNSEAKVIVTTPTLLPRIPVEKLPALQKIMIVGEQIEESDKHIDFLKAMNDAASDFDIEWMDKEDGMILHYTSGSTGAPKGVLHVHYAMIQQYKTAQWVLDLKEDDVFWCTADPGWIRVHLMECSVRG